jgi:hypothetical protein
VTINWCGIKWFCLGMAAGIACHRSDAWAGIPLLGFVIAAAFDRLHTREDSSQ